MKVCLKVLSVVIVSLSIISFSYAGLEPATQEAFQKKEVSGLGTIYKIATMDGSIYIAGAPTEEGLKQLKKLKIKTFINLQTRKETNFDEKAALKKLGIRYVDIPVNIKDFNVDSIKQFNKAIYSSKDYPIYVHCRTANRAAMMMVFNNVTQYKVPVKAAIEEAKNYGLTDHSLESFIEKTVKRNQLAH